MTRICVEEGGASQVVPLVTLLGPQTLTESGLARPLRVIVMVVSATLCLGANKMISTCIRPKEHSGGTAYRCLHAMHEHADFVAQDLLHGNIYCGRLGRGAMPGSGFDAVMYWIPR